MNTITFKAFGLVAATYAWLGLIPMSAMLIQDFETDTSGVTRIQAAPLDTSANPVRVASGGINIPTTTSAQGGGHFAEVAFLYNDGFNDVGVQGDRIKFNDGAPTGGYQSGFGFSIDVFFDDPSFYFGNDGFFFQPTILNDGNVGAVNGGGFGARLIEDAGGNYWQVGADGNAKGYSGVSSTHDIATAGWYTMETVWRDNALTGDIDQVNRLIEIASGDVVYSEIFENAIAAGQAGALGAASVGAGDIDVSGSMVGPGSTFGDLAIDNISIVPEPSSAALILSAISLAFAASRRRRR